MLRTSSSRLRFHYEYILRQDLLLKLNYTNIMQVPRLCEINICSTAKGGLDYIKNVSLALEIICGQKCLERINQSENTRQNFYALAHRSSARKSENRCAATKSKQSRGPRFAPLGALQNTSFRLLETSLHSQESMYNFLEKLITALAFFDYTVRCVAHNSIQITLARSGARLFPEIQNHFEFFENVQNLQVTIITSALSEKETLLLWTGLKEKEN